MANTPKLQVNGKELPYWYGVQIDRSMDALADTFSLVYKRHSAVPKAGEANPLAFDGDEEVLITLDGQELLTGYIDHVPVSSTARGDTVTLDGYSRTADLVKCPVQPRSKTYKDQTIQSICEDLCKPYDIKVEVDESATEAASTKLVRFKTEFGEVVKDALDRACRYGGLLLFSSPGGGLRLSRAGSKRIETVLFHGLNVIAMNIDRDARDRHSHYYVLSDGANGFDPDDTDKDDGRVALAEDPGVGRFRPTIIASEADVKTQSQRRTQAEWERNRRAGMSLSVSVEFPSWSHSQGVWEPNTLVRVVHQRYGLDLDLLLTSVSLTRDAGGSAARLELVHPAAYAPRKIPLPRRRKARAKAADREGDAFPTAPNVWHFDDTGFADQYGQEGPWDGDLQLEDTEVVPF